MEKQQGKLPETEIIKLEGDSNQWRLFERKLTTSLSFFGIIEHEDKKLRIEIEISRVLPPESKAVTIIGERLVSNFNLVQTNGLSRIMDYFQSLINKNIWVMFGHIKGQNNIPVILVHYVSFDLTIYAQKLLGEETFLPNGICLN